MSHIEQRVGPDLHDLEDITQRGEGLNVWEEYEETFAAAPFEYGIMEIRRVLNHMRGLDYQIHIDQIREVDLLQQILAHIINGHGIEVHDGQ